MAAAHSTLLTSRLPSSRGKLYNYHHRNGNIAALPMYRQSTVLVFLVSCSEVSTASAGKNGEWTIPVLPAMDLRSVDSVTTAPDDITMEHSSMRLPQRKFSVLPRSTTKKRHGRLSIDLQGNSFGMSFNNDDDTSRSIEPTSETSLSIDPAATVRLVRVVLASSGAFISAFMGTLRLLAPLIVARRSLNTLGDLVYDYSMGRYFRTTYTRMEHLYVRFFELPAAFRAISRTVAQLCILLVLSNIMEWMVGPMRHPCRTVDGRCSYWCSLLWLGSVFGTGHFFSSSLAQWGGPLRIQVAASHFSTTRRSSVVARVFTRPWHIFQWMQDPEAWVSMMATPSSPLSEPFDPNPMLFPATWLPLRLVQLLAVASAISSAKDLSIARGLMKRCVVQTALTDEWHRVFINERRVALGSCIGLLYLISQLVLAIGVAKVYPTAAVAIIPTCLAIVVSVWMNVVVFWNRLEKKRQDAAIQAFQQSGEAALRVIKWP